MKRRILPLIVSLALCLGMVSPAALAADSGFNWQIENSSGQVTNSGTSDPVSQSNLAENTLVITGGTGSSISTTGMGGTLELRGGTIDASGNISAAQYATITSGTINVTGEITAGYSITISGGNITANSISINKNMANTTLALNITGGIVDVGTITVQNSNSTSGSTGANATFSVDGNAVVFANSVTVGVSGQGSGTANKTYTKGVVFEGETGTVYGEVTLPDDVTIPEDYTLTIPSGAKLIVPSGTTLTNEGTITVESGGTFTNSGTIEDYGTINGTVNGTPAKVPATVTMNDATGTYGGSVTLTATVKDSNGDAATSGTVYFYQGTETSGDPLNSGGSSVTNGKATYNLTLDDASWTPSDTAYTITAVYNGGTGLLSGRDTAQLTVNKATHTVTPTGPNSSVNRYETSIILAAVNDNNTATYGPIQYGYKTGTETEPGHWQDSTTFTGLQPGTDYTFYTRYAGTAYYEASNPSTRYLTDTTLPAIDTTGLENGYVGVPYSETLEASVATGKTVTWALLNNTSLPDGLTLDNSTGVISGNPTTIGTFKFSVQATIKDQPDLSNMDELSITINQGTPTFTANTYKNGEQTSTFTYGDIITVSGSIAASSTPPAASNGANVLSEPAQNQVALFLGEEQLTQPVTVSGDTFSITYDTGNKGISATGQSQTLTVKYGGSSTLNSGSADVSITLNPKPVTVTFTGSTTKVYDTTNAAPEGLIVGLSNGVVVGTDEVTLSYTSITYDTADVGVGKTITARGLSLGGSNSGCYTLSSNTATTSGSITAAASSVTTAPTANTGLAYTGSDQALVTAGAASGGTMVYALGTDATTAPTSGYIATIPTGTNAGTYYVWYMVDGDSNHNDTDAACVTVTIGQVTLTVSATADGKTYDGTTTATGSIILSGSVNNEQPAATGTFAFDDANAGNDKTVNVTNIALTDTWSTNYALNTNSTTAKAAISPLTATLVWSGYENLTYTGNPANVTATVDNLVAGDDCTVTVEGGAETDVGQYTANATGLSNSNYAMPTGGTSQTYSISAASVTVDTAPAANTGLTYTGSAQALVTAGAASGGTMMYALGTDATTAPDSFETAIPTGTDAGTYYVWYMVDGDSNHNDTAPVCVEVTIAKATPTLSLTASPESLRGRGTVTLTLTGVPEGGSATVTCDNDITVTANSDGTYTATLPNRTQTYTFTASYAESDNYNSATVTRTVEVTYRSTYVPPADDGPNTPTSEGWDSIQDEIADANDGDEIVVDMGGTTEVPAEIFEEVAGKDVDVTFELDNGVSWTVNGKDIPEGADISDLDLGVSLGTSGISVDVINSITGEVGTVQITLEHDGEFGFALTLTAPLGRENAGYWANLYHYDESNERLTFETSARIAADGTAALRMTHASQYAIVIDDVSHAVPFEDVSEDDWFYDAVAYAYRNDLMVGVSDDLFNPDGTTTRAQIVTILYRLEGEPVVNYLLPFDDVAEGEWYTEAVRWAASEGIVLGTSDTTYSPNAPVTREQLAAILYRYAAYKGYDVTERADLSAFTDADEISTYAVDALAWANAVGIVNGTSDTTLNPQGSATRAQVAAMLQRFCENIVE